MLTIPVSKSPNPQIPNRNYHNEIFTRSLLLQIHKGIKSPTNKRGSTRLQYETYTHLTVLIARILFSAN